MVLLSEMEKEQVGKEIKRSALHCTGQASQMVLVVKNLPANAGDTRDVSSIPGLGRSPGVVNGNLLQYSGLKNPWTEEHGGLQSDGPQRVRYD